MHKQRVYARPTRSRQAGFTAVEILMVMLVSAVMAGFAVPTIKSVLYQYRMHAAVQNINWAIQSTRYQALDAGYPYQLALTGTTSGSSYVNPTYQISNETVGAASFSTVGSSVPVAGFPVFLSAPTTLQFNPNGSVSATTGALTFNVTYQGYTESFTVTTYGKVNVTP
jgi:prepilin-type N-terminal cleavage/methylation domain-containing protein